MDLARFAHTLRAQAPGGAETEVSLTLGATTIEAIKALCKAMGLEDHTQDLSLFLREETGARILQTSDRPLELYLQQVNIPDGLSPFLVRRLPQHTTNSSVTENSPYSFLAVAQGIEDYMRLPIPPSEDNVVEFASLRLLLDKDPLSPGVVAQNIERYIHPCIRSKRTAKDWDVLVLSRAKARGHPTVQTHRLFVEFIDSVDLTRMEFFEATYLSPSDPVSVFLAVDSKALHIYDRETHNKLALHPLHSIHSWTVDVEHGKLEFLIAWRADKHMLTFMARQAYAIISLIKYHVARALEHIL